jgi:hypothetical protein
VLFVRQLLLGLLLAFVVWILGRHVAAIVILVFVGTTATVCAFSPRASALFSSLLTKVQGVVGRVLSYLLLGFIEIIVFTPAAAVLWLFRRDPLALGHRRSDPTLWRDHVGRGRRPLYKHQFTYEWPARDHRHTLVGGLALVVGSLVLLMACDLGVGLAVDAIQGHPSPTRTTLFSSQIAAIPKTSWWPTVLADTFGIAAGTRTDPFLGWTFSNYEGSPFTHLVDGVRSSYEPPVAPGKKPVEVLFLGGSTVAGSYQRDDFTIPSDVARLAAQHGVPIHVTNGGAQGYSVWQELDLLERLLATGYRPNVVVFYDGVNELYVQAANGTTTEPSNIKARTYANAIQRYLTVGSNQSLFDSAVHDYASTSALVRAFRTITGNASSPAPAEVDNILWDPDRSTATASTRGVDAADLHNQAMAIASALAARYQFHLLSFWQPFLYSKSPIKAEANVAGLWGETPSEWRAMDEAARAHLASSEIDLSSALNGSKIPVMIDFMHTNEFGAQEVADAIYPHLAPDLVSSNGTHS